MPMFKSAVDPHKLEIFIEINDLLNSSYSDLNGLFTRILESATRLTDGEASSLLLSFPDSNKLEFIVALGSKGDQVKAFSLNKGEGIAGWVAEKNRALIVNNVEDDERFCSDISKNVNFKTNNILAVPLRVKGDCVGVIEIVNKKNDSLFTIEDQTWLELFATQAGLALRNAQNFQALNEEVKILRKSEVSKNNFIIGTSSVIQQILFLAKKYASTDSTVIIYGESGTGKELLAEFIHEHSNRSTGPFVKINCAAIPEELLEDELFGHVKGAYTDASRDRIGRFELAQSGTIFLDEIGEISLATQAKLLRILQNKTLEKVGSNQVINLDVRVLAATNKDLSKEVLKDTFRKDLYYRLNVLPIKMPSLKERTEDIPSLTQHFLQEKSKQLGKTNFSITSDCLNYLMKSEWPGNIRQLQNVIERALLLSKTGVLTRDDFLVDEKKIENPIKDLKNAITDFKRSYIIQILDEVKGNQTKAANKLNIQRTYLSKLMKELNII